MDHTLFMSNLYPEIRKNSFLSHFEYDNKFAILKCDVLTEKKLSKTNMHDV